MGKKYNNLNDSCLIVHVRLLPAAITSSYLCSFGQWGRGGPPMPGSSSGPKSSGESIGWADWLQGESGRVTVSRLFIARLWRARDGRSPRRWWHPHGNRQRPTHVDFGLLNMECRCHPRTTRTSLTFIKTHTHKQATRFNILYNKLYKQ